MNRILFEVLLLEAVLNQNNEIPLHSFSASLLLLHSSSNLLDIIFIHGTLLSSVPPQSCGFLPGSMLHWLFQFLWHIIHILSSHFFIFMPQIIPHCLEGNPAIIIQRSQVMTVIMGFEKVFPICDLIFLTVFQHLIPEGSIPESASCLILKQIFFRSNLIFLLYTCTSLYNASGMGIRL